MIEQQLITALLQGNITTDDIRSYKFTSDFLPILGELFDWILDYEITHGKLPSVDLAKTKSPVFQEVAVSDHPLEILKTLKERHSGNYLEQTLLAGYRLYKKTGNVRRAIDFVETKFSLMEDGEEEDVFEISSPDFILGEQDYAERRKAVEGQGYYGIPTGFGTEFDNYLNGGWLKGNMYGLVGQTGIGKSWLAQVASRGGLKHGKNMFYLALEGIVVKEYYRFLTMIVNEAENTKLQAGLYSVDEFKFYENQMREWVTSSGAKMFLGVFGKRQRYTPKILERRIKRYKPDMVIIDYGTMMSVGATKEHWIDFMDVTKQVKTLASRPDINIPILMLLQGAIGKNNEKFVLEDIAQSKGMARDFDEIIGVTRVAGRKNTIRINSDKARDSEGVFDALFQTGWNSGKLEYIGDVPTGDGSF